ncbi:MAG: hypothetical protein GXY33_00850 [Phycisphaerae bacterium]|nr:hypothetical protein [Phycisphaerae bacterium]
MSSEMGLLLATAASIGFFHTLLGPDHYLPFIMMSKAGRWSLPKTTAVTFACGVGHIGSSVVLGFAGIALGAAVDSLVEIESHRGQIAAWGLIAFGFAYFVWGLRRAYRNQPHRHWHEHGEQESHVHEHTHHQEHVHVHSQEAAVSMTPWILFTIFVFGPCEPLIPVLMYPAIKNSLWGVAAVAGVFGAVTIATMMGVVLLSSAGLSFVPLGKLERYAHALAGLVICGSGLAIQFLGL